MQIAVPPIQPTGIGWLIALIVLICCVVLAITSARLSEPLILLGLGLLALARLT